MSMMVASTRAFYLALFLCAAFSGVYSENVLTLDVNTIDDALKAHNFILVEFYAPWCGHCKQLAPEYEKAATILKGKNPEIVLAKVDVDQEKNKPLSPRFNVEGFPTLKLIRNETNIQDYDGPREADGIVDYLLKQAGPSSIHLSTKEQAEEFYSANPVSVTAVVDSEDSPDLTKFIEITNMFRAQYSFAHTTDPSLLPDVGVPVKTPVVRVIKNFDDGFNDLHEISEKEMIEFIQDKTLPVLVEMGKDPSLRPHLIKVFNLPVGKALLFYKYSEKDFEKIKDAYKEVAKTFGGKLRFVFGDATDNEQALEYFGVTVEETPVIMVHEPDNKKYVSRNVDAEAMVKFLNDYKEGKLEAFTKSEPLPENNNGDVKVIVGKSFDDIVYKSGKNVLIEFYAPWCGHCKSLAPIYEKVGAEFSGDSSVVIANMDATANDVPGTDFDVQGFPTIYLHTASGENILFEGSRTKQAIVDFVKENKVETEPEVLEAAGLEKAEAKEAEAEEKEAEAEAEKKEEEPSKDEL